MDHSEKTVETLQIDCPVLSDLRDKPVLNVIENLFHYGSVLKINEARDSSYFFSLKLVTIEDIRKEKLALDASKATQSNDMPTKIPELARKTIDQSVFYLMYLKFMKGVTTSN